MKTVVAARGGFNPLSNGFEIPRGWLSFRIAWGNPSHWKSVPNKYFRNINWILQKKGSQGQAPRKSMSHSSFGKCFISWALAFSGISISMQLSTLPLSISGTVPIIFSAVSFACENAKDTQTGWHWFALAQKYISEQRGNQLMIYWCQCQWVSMKCENTLVTEKLAFFFSLFCSQLCLAPQGNKFVES